MQASKFNLRVPLADRGEAFLMNTLTDAQAIVTEDVLALLDRVGSLDDLGTIEELSDEERDVLDSLCANGFVVRDRDTERQALVDYFTRVKRDTRELNITLLTTLQCNFACDYCYQGDHDDSNKFAEKMSLETASRVGDWIEREMDRQRPSELAITFFGGEPLLNLPVMYAMSERLWNASARRGVEMRINIITNGLLLTEEVVDRLLPYGLSGIKVTLDG